MKIVKLDCKRMREKKAAHEYIAEALGFPEYYGHNLDALYDCLHETGECRIILQDTCALDSDFGGALLSTFRDAAASSRWLDLEEIKDSAKFERTFYVVPSICDINSRMSMADTFALFMDIATEHATQLGLGNREMAAKGLFWTTIRTRVKFKKRPYMMSKVTASTWPGPPQKARCDRFYTVTKDGETVIEGRTEWAVVGLQDGKVHSMEGVYPEGLKILDDTVCTEPFTRFEKKWDDAEELETYTVRSTDIDLGKHMNNVAYIRTALGAFSNAEIKEMAVSEIEVCFRRACYEGEKLKIVRRGRDIAFIKENGEAAFFARFI